MKKISITLLLFLATIQIHAQSKDEKDVAAAVEAVRKAMIDGDKTALENITADALSYGHSSGAVEDKKTFIENLTNGKSDFVTIDLADQVITVSGETALVRHKMTGTTNNNGTPGNLNINILLVFQKQKGKWKLLARQAIRPPQ